jgi:hypothetical protein
MASSSCKRIIVRSVGEKHGGKVRTKMLYSMSRLESRVGVLDGYVGIGRFQIVIDEQESNAL